MIERGNIWTRRFIWGALIQGGILFIITLYMLYLNLPGTGFSPARVVASGSGGTWLEIGYIGYMLFVVLGAGVSAFFYYYIESVMNRPFTGKMNLLAWGHLLLGNFGALGLILMMYGGYNAGAAVAPVALGGLGKDALYVHENILGPLSNPIAYLFLVGALSPLAGGLGYFMQLRKR